MRILRIVVFAVAVTVLAGCARDVAPVSAPQTVAAATTTGVAGVAASPVVVDPIEVAPRDQGGPVIAVALEVSTTGASDPRLRAAATRVPGYPATVIDVDCDQGVRDALRLRPGTKYTYAAIYFYSDETAFRFEDKYQLHVAGIMRVKPITACH